MKNTHINGYGFYSYLFLFAVIILFYYIIFFFGQQTLHSITCYYNINFLVIVYNQSSAMKETNKEKPISRKWAMEV